MPAAQPVDPESNADAGIEYPPAPAEAGAGDTLIGL